jgi:DNA gyrase subunit B
MQSISQKVVEKEAKSKSTSEVSKKEVESAEDLAKLAEEVTGAESDDDTPKEDNPLKKAGINIQRYKGLGEMNPEQLWETTMDPQNRVLLQVKVDDAERADAIFNKLMGEEVSLRKTFIQTHAKDVTNLDV